MSTPEKVGGTKHRASPPLQKVGGTCPPVHPRICAHGIDIWCVSVIGTAGEVEEEDEEEEENVEEMEAEEEAMKHDQLTTFLEQMEQQYHK